MLAGNDESIWDYLRKLNEIPTPSPFSQAFSQLMAQYATKSAGAKVSRKLISTFLNREIRYYRQVEQFRHKETPTVADLRSVAGKRRIALCDLIDRANQAGSETTEGEIARQLLLAECYHHIEKPEKVVAHLERALEDGADDPLVYFALGYNRLHLAMESFGPTLTHPEAIAPDEQISMQAICLEAVSAFENALTGTESDGQVYYWIGRALEAAGFDEAAAEAFDKVEEFEYNEEEDRGSLSEEISGFSDQTEPDAVSQEPITEVEIEQFGELLQEPIDISALWPDDDNAPEP